MSKHLVAVSGPTCSGKSTLKKTLVARDPKRVLSIATSTTRDRRAGEMEWVDYRFRSKADFKLMVANESMVEWIKLRENYYGIEKDALLKVKAGKTNGVIVVTPEAITRLSIWCDDNQITIVSVFLNVRTEHLLERIKKRYERLGDPKEMQRRQQAIAREASAWKKAYDYDVVIENGIDEAVSLIGDYISR